MVKRPLVCLRRVSSGRPAYFAPLSRGREHRAVWRVSSVGDWPSQVSSGIIVLSGEYDNLRINSAVAVSKVCLHCLHNDIITEVDIALTRPAVFH